MEVTLTPTEKRKIVCEMYLNGFTYREIMRATGYKTTSAIAKIIASRGLANRLPDFPDELVEKIFELWQERLSLSQIGIKLGLGKDQVRYQLKKMCLVD